MDSQAAPGELEYVREFVNTLDLDEGQDQLENPDALASWLRERDLLGTGLAVGERDLKRALELRDGFRQLLLANNGANLDPRSVKRLNQAAGDASLSIRFDSDGAPTLSVAGSGAGAVIAPLVAIAYDAMVAGTWSRLKACPADDCQWAFYDHSRNRSGTWCSMRVCGNRAKVRRYRERRGGSSGSA